MDDIEARLFKNWWLLSIKAFLAIILSTISLANPEKTIDKYSNYLGVIIIVAGISILYHAFQYRILVRSIKLWVPEGMLDILVGVTVLWQPQFLSQYILMILAFWILSVGVIQIFTAFYLQYEMQNWWAMLFMGVILCVLSFAQLLSPLSSSVYIAVMVGLASILTCFLVIYIARRIKQYQDE